MNLDTIDFVLAYESKNDEREGFENTLKKVGLLLETESLEKLNFLKISVPQDVLYQYAEILKLRMPIISSEDSDTNESQESNRISKIIAKILDLLKVRQESEYSQLREYELTAEFSRDKLYLFNTCSKDFFNKSTKIYVVSYILERNGIKKLLAEGVYKAAFPLHEGSLQNNDSLRKKLFNDWASFSRWIEYQPIDKVKDYFGVKIALYFTWLGFYTHMLIPASLFGVFCFLYAIITLPSDKICQDICHSNITMCPMCDKYCPYWKLKDTCTYSKASYLIDNYSTILFAIFMSVWSALYLRLWKRYSADVTHRWGLSGFDLQAEPPRPEYLLKLTSAKTKKNVVTMLWEPVVPFWRVKLSTIISFGIVLFCMSVTIIVVLAIILCRLALLSSGTLYADNLSLRIYAVPAIASVINGICIVILNYFYNKLAHWLTETEMHRTQTEYEDSLTLKMFMFQFINYFTFIFYLALLKGKFLGYPGNYNRLFGYRQEECQPGGCITEVAIQLIGVMLVTQIWNYFLRILCPLLMKWYYKIKFKLIEATIQFGEVIVRNQTGERIFGRLYNISRLQFNRDCFEQNNCLMQEYNLLDFESGLFAEYLKMVLQFSFVTIFVAAFPLAPLLALINNTIVMRLDAKKLLKYFRRPVPKLVKDIGVWLHIMNFMCRISIIANGFVIAFSSQFIPKLVYKFHKSNDGTLEGFLEYTLAYFNTTDFMNGTAPINNPMNITMCRYKEFRNPPNHSMKYHRPLDYWHVLAARLAFIVVYENFVGFIITCIQWVIPDTPRKLSDLIKREAYETNEAIIKEEENTKKSKRRRSL